MNPSKKAEMSLNVIIVAVLALVILIILILIFTGKAKVFTNQTSETEQQYSASRCEGPASPAKCRTSTECDDERGISMGEKDCGSGKVCCSQ
ncbi:MAG: hypothetical protein KJ574_04735 [Nanoarchaeota archaeon]|nr:hypothetical protein [Nanoarchaeota archaeon]